MVIDMLKCKWKCAPKVLTPSRALDRLGRAHQTARWVCALALAVLWSATASAAAEPIKIVAYGDSLVAGFGLSPSQSFPVRLEKALKAKGFDVSVSNAGVSGDTTAAGLARFDWAIGPDVDAVILELGANDALRGLPPAQARANLTAIMEKLKAKGVPVLIAGMRAPNNWGEDYRKSFDTIYPDLARQFEALLDPFFLDGVALDPNLNQSDGIHPNAAGVDKIVERILPLVEKLIARVRQSG